MERESFCVCTSQVTQGNYQPVYVNSLSQQSLHYGVKINITYMIFKLVFQVPLVTFSPIQSLGTGRSAEPMAQFFLFHPFIICYICHEQLFEGLVFILNSLFPFPVDELKCWSTAFIWALKPTLLGQLDFLPIQSLREGSINSVPQMLAFQFPSHFW